jgi:hypothetical protein
MSDREIHVAIMLNHNVANRCRNTHHNSYVK